jgi:hypothetical protein
LIRPIILRRNEKGERVKNIENMGEVKDNKKEEKGNVYKRKR